MKYLNDGRTVVITYDDGKSERFDTSTCPDNVRDYAEIRGFRKMLSDMGAGFEGTQEALRDAQKERFAQWQDGHINGVRSVSGIPTEPQLADAMRLIAPDATAAAIEACVKMVHPDHTNDTKAKAKRRRQLRKMMDNVQLRDALEKVGFVMPSANLDDLLKGL